MNIAEARNAIRAPIADWPTELAAREVLSRHGTPQEREMVRSMYAPQIAARYGRTMVDERVSYDEAADSSAVLHRRSTRFFQLSAGLLILAVFISAISTWVYIEDVAPTAAEVMAPGFDLEAKLAEVQP